MGLKNLYGLTVHEVDALCASQGGLCAICGRANPPHVKQALAVDHQHGTKHIRGLLCLHCNQGLGKFRDDPSLLRLAAEYLEKRKT